ncbi:ABC transporter substrate-binding protein [Gordonia desulfuricans]|uniref:ABC transporter substrate-binding protein n=1 Tax=Gordonia desulfuricans TaxID=89051 RepID=A0A7K3LKZ3_9ACTN|nr:ABC transporter substrate-binding protein [Gordonia desulfuricans]
MKRRAMLAMAGAVAMLAAACSGSTDEQDDRLVLATGYELGDYNPMMGYGQLGVSPIYEGLLQPQADDDTVVPDLVPALAAAAPARIGDTNTWRIPLRENISFSDGTAFDSADVVATYRAVRNPAVASEISTDVAPITEITADGPNAVVVKLDTAADPSPYLLLGIVPSERVQDAPAAEWKLNTEPVGTGPYRLDSLQPDQAVLVARDDYWGRAPQLRRVVYSYVPDDNTRAQRIAAGEVDGTNLPPRLANTLDGRDGAQVVAVRSADWRGVSLPAGNAFTADVQARLAMNLGVDRQALVTDVLAGRGEPSSTPIAPVYGEAYDAATQFGYDRAAAEAVLERAGWIAGGDGIRAKGTDRASFTLLYNAQDTLRRDLSVAFAAAMKPLGVEVTPRGTSWDDIDTRLGTDAVLLGGGSAPYSIDSQVYDTLHTRVPDSSPYSNPGNFTAPGLDALLDAARMSAPSPENTERYRQIQRVYAQAPSSVFLTFLHHTYVSRPGAWTHDAPILEPHSHGVTWGPWWNLPSWTEGGR